ncbi:hypothetical protein QK899_08595 [Pseudomonas sp. AR5]|nr:hypothetical protein QK899_08595 [Pseudomonas sp. AR5]
MSRNYLSTRTLGFFSDSLHGARTIIAPDPQVAHQFIEVANPTCLLPPTDELIELTDEQYQALRDAAASGQKISIDEHGVPFVCAPPLPSIAEKIAILANQIDVAADLARARVAGDPLRAVEYDRARIEARAFADAGYPTDAVPRTVAAWAINGRTAQQAADSILAEAAAYTEALYVIRETRLAAKEQIRTLMDAGEVEQAQQLAEQTIAAIEAAVAGVGNAAA